MLPDRALGRGESGSSRDCDQNCDCTTDVGGTPVGVDGDAMACACVGVHLRIHVAYSVCFLCAAIPGKE